MNVAIGRCMEVRGHRAPGTAATDNSEQADVGAMS